MVKWHQHFRSRSKSSNSC